MKLDLYNKKRNFKKTPEPKGVISYKNKNLFVVQKHAARHLHYDFRLALNGVLLSWAVPKGPCLDPSIKRLAMHVEDHPIEYGYFEGIIPAGEYGGGTVMLWDMGEWNSEDKNPTAAYHKGHLKFTLHATKLKGKWSLIKLKKEDNRAWFLIKGKDEFAKSLSQYDITIEAPDSVTSGLNLEDIASNSERMWTRHGEQKRKVGKGIKSQKNIRINLSPSEMISSITPQLATLVNEAPKGNEWLHELKFDGYRILAFIEKNKIRLVSRNNKDWSEYFPNLIKEFLKLKLPNTILDGEIVVLDGENKSNFQLLQNSIKSNVSRPFVYYIFDIIYYKKYKLTSLPLIERKKILREVIPIDNETIRYSDHIIGSGADVHRKACEMGLEGIISKEIDSIYQERRTKTWLKVKCVKRQEFVIGGFSPPQGARQYFGSLYLGYYEKGILKYCGNVGTGFNQKSLRSIHEKLDKLSITKNPFHVRPPGVTTATWVKPKLVAEVEFTEWTNDGTLRHPSFKGLRTDKIAKKITREIETPIRIIEHKAKSKPKPKKQHTNAELPFKLTNPQKILYPESKITKLDLLDYYGAIQKWILPYIVNRPLTLVRCPENYHKCFYQKHINKSSPKYLYGISIKETGKAMDYIYIKDWHGLASIVQMGALEIHPWGSRIADVEAPDIITLDLDPADDVPWSQVVATAKLIREHLGNFKLKSFVKNTGGKGLHVVIPIKPEYHWDQIKIFAHVFVKFLVENYPQDYIGEMSKTKRKGKIFIDYLRNQRGATAIAAYSSRARKGAPVSVPLHWDELTNNREDTDYNILTLPERLLGLKKDPWKDFFKIQQSLNLEKL